MKRLFCIFAFCCMLFAADSEQNFIYERNSVSQKSGKIKISKELDTYFSQMTSKLQTLWTEYQVGISDEARVCVEFSTDGRVIDYQILELGRSTEFNQKLRKFLDELPKRSFPKSPDNKSHTFEMVLSDVAN
ncbi:MAG: TonB C-terminal domain-containing protein [Campylobacter gracilis]|uniref:TonB C-terminal domain-containing protein n=1 Tax=Campylobacter gracilis TaxID=824 RepID=UPI0026ED4B94|nr:TonB C-terminal domain-containing protein [Campylobacter gracilis]MBS6152980.1 TonB C-terminal domain-containing protein [Campylobacter gracilis]